MKQYTVNIIPWEQARKRLPKNHENENVFRALDKVATKLKDKKQDYVYEIELEFGDKFIVNSENILVNNISKINKEHYPSLQELTLRNLQNDLDYGNDPMAIVVDNQVEVSTINECEGRTRKIKERKRGIDASEQYRVPLNIFSKGDIFGVFGTLNFLFNGEKSKPTLFNGWDGFAGSSSLLVEFPFFYGEKITIPEDVKDIFALEAKDSKYEPGKENIEFVKRFTPSTRQLSTKLIFVPINFLQKITDYDFLNLKYLISLIGVKQYSLLGQYSLDVKAISEAVHSVGAIKGSMLDFYLHLYELITNVKQGKNFAYIPISSLSEHYLSPVLENFKVNNSRYFSTKQAWEPLIFTYSKLDNTITKGFLSKSNLPILKGYKENHSKVSDILKNLREIDKAIQKNCSAEEYSYYSIHDNIRAFMFNARESSNPLDVETMNNLANELAFLAHVDSVRLNPAYNFFYQTIMVSNE